MKIYPKEKTIFYWMIQVLKFPAGIFIFSNFIAFACLIGFVLLAAAMRDGMWIVLSFWLFAVISSILILYAAEKYDQQCYDKMSQGVEDTDIGILIFFLIVASIIFFSTLSGA